MSKLQRRHWIRRLLRQEVNRDWPTWAMYYFVAFQIGMWAGIAVGLGLRAQQALHWLSGW